MTSFSITDDNKIKRVPMRGHYDHATVYEILDAEFICHVGFVDNGKPIVIPMSYGRKDNLIFLHGASSARIMNLMASDNFVCLSVTHVDGIVVARSMFDASVNYRSVVLFGKAVVVPGEKKADALQHISEHILPGRWQEFRPPSASELKATTVLEVNNEHASAKMRSGPPDGNVRDLDLPVWAGVIPLKLLADTPIPDPGLRSNHDVPPSVLASIKYYSQPFQR
ncbi:MAG TPA: pyridoxamine 5'-phosphate oxidase family protein [Chryseolinea sp.]|nr:pyridoxamine 5'-phosphate oxidase family protein [Chryseolinea sp.]